MRLKTTEFGEIMHSNGPYAVITPLRSFKVADFGTNRKPIYDFLQVINTNLPPTLHRVSQIPLGPVSRNFLVTSLTSS